MHIIAIKILTTRTLSDKDIISLPEIPPQFFNKTQFTIIRKPNHICIQPLFYDESLMKVVKMIKVTSDISISFIGFAAPFEECIFIFSLEPLGKHIAKAINYGLHYHYIQSIHSRFGDPRFWTLSQNQNDYCAYRYLLTRVSIRYNNHILIPNDGIVHTYLQGIYYIYVRMILGDRVC